mmetsp:Transcript_45543/g.97653  ORF Transcript_45543/g.97653 Transcript_45543/m.97653 type:complete len:1025 (+) Transcript_45543:55-3129(+)
MSSQTTPSSVLRRLQPLFLLTLAGFASPVVDAKCTLEPLQAVGKGKYIRTTGESANYTTCSELTRGECPYAVPYPGMTCMVNCVASEADCLTFNRGTEGVNPYEDPYLCTSCSISACRECEYHGKGKKPTCKQCFDGFVGIGGADGRWEECVIWDQGAILSAASVLMFITIFLTLLLIATTAVGGGCCRATAAKVLPARARSSFSSFSAEPLLNDEDDAQLREHNMRAISTGLSFSLRSSIKFSALAAMFKIRADNADQSWTRKWMAILRKMVDHSHMSDMGVGLQLFFNVQVFLIAVSFVTFVVAYVQSFSISDSSQQHLFQQIASHHCPSNPMDLIGSLERQSPKADFAAQSKIAVIGLWVVLVLMSWAFHYYQSEFTSEFDRKTHSAEDYTLQLTGLPDCCVSERALKLLLEEELRMHGKLQGVSICYDLLQLEEEDREHIEEMLETLTEYDTWKNGWCSKDLCIEDLDRRIEHDQEHFTKFIKSGKLKCSGEAFVVFKNQADMFKVQEERCGIRKEIFFAQSEGEMMDMIHPKHTDVANAQSLKTRKTKSGVGKSAGEFVKVTGTVSEPGGVRFEAYKEPDEKHAMSINVWMPLRMLLYILIYTVAAQAFYSSMVEPFQANMLEGMENSLSIALVSKIVIALNFLIQTMVMVDVEKWGNLRSFSLVDQRTFLWNTLLLVITNGYILMQECWRDGIHWKLTAPVGKEELLWDWQRIWFQSATVEQQVGKSLAATMMEQIMMLYVLGEVGNVLAPVVCYWVALRAIYVWRIGGKDSYFQKMLKKLLPHFRSKNNTITAREAEKSQILMPLLLWMEYTYVVVFAWMAFCTFFLATTEGYVVCGLLLCFSILFYIWQRYVMLWLYGKATYDTNETYNAFIRVWGFVLATLPPQAVWWAYRLGEIQEQNFMLVVMLLVFLVAILFYQWGIIFVNWKVDGGQEGIDDFGEGGDPGYKQVMESVFYSWWNVNPIYVLKSRYCPYEPGFEVHVEELQRDLWPQAHQERGLFEPGKEFRHELKSNWEES